MESCVFWKAKPNIQHELMEALKRAYPWCIWWIAKENRHRTICTTGSQSELRYFWVKLVFICFRDWSSCRRIWKKFFQVYWMAKFQACGDPNHTLLWNLLEVMWTICWEGWNFCKTGMTMAHPVFFGSLGSSLRKHSWRV